MYSRKVSKEQRIAIDVFMQHYCTNFTNVNATSVARTDPLLSTNFVVASSQPISISDVPCQIPWNWNQSNSKLSVDFPSIHLELKKISPRLRSGCKKLELEPKIPSFKLWMYKGTISQACGYFTEIYFVWCEKGVEGAGIETDIGIIYPNQLSVECFAFLSPFVDQEIAMELGWL